MALEDLRQATLSRLDLPTIEHSESPFEEVVVTLMAPRDELDEQSMWESIALPFAERAAKTIADKAEGRTPTGIGEAAIDYSDQADCEDAEGRVTNAFISGQRCYRLVLQVAFTADPGGLEDNG